MRKGMRRGTLLASILAIGLILALAVSGCGSGQKAGAPSGQQQATGGGAAAAGEIPVGYLTSYTGEMGAFGVPGFNAAKLAVDEMNAAGGPLGRQLRLYTEDDQSSVEQGLRGARKLITTNKVVSISGPISDIVLGIMDYAKQNKVVVTSHMAGTTKLDTLAGDYVFRTVPSDSMDGKVAAHILWEKGFRRLGVLYENDEGRRSIANAVKSEFTKLGGQIVADQAFNPKQTTYSAELKKVFDAKPDAVWIGAGQESGTVLLKEWKQRGYGGQLMVASDLAVPEMFKLVGKDVMEGIISEIPSASTETPEYKRFAEAYKKAYGQEPVGNFEANSYDQMILIGLAIEAAGEASGEAINRTIRKVANPPGTVVHTFAEGVAELRKGNDINYEGASGPVDLDEHGNVSGSYSALVAKDGKWVQFKFYKAGSF